MVQSLSPNLGDSPIGNRVSNGFGALLDRARAAVMPATDGTAGSPAVPPMSARVGRVLTRTALVVSALLLVVAVGLFAFRALYGDRIYPAITVADVPVGGLTESAAQQKLQERSAIVETGGLTLTYGGQTFTPTAAELGVTFEVDDAVAEAAAIGRSGDAVDRLSTTSDLLQADATIPLRSTLDRNTLNAWFDAVDAQINKPAQNASLVLSGTEVSVTPETIGTVVDREAATALVMQMMGNLQPVSSDLPVKDQMPTVFASDLESAREQVENTLSEHVRVVLGDESWRIETETIAQFLTVEQPIVDGKVQVTLAVDEKGLADWLRAEFTDKVNRAPVDAQVAWKDGRGLYATSESADGQTMKAGEFASRVAASFLGDHEMVDIPTVVTKPRVDQNNLEALKIDSLIGRGDSNYDGSSDSRSVNIGVGVNLLSGTMVAPGEEFSFNGAIGEITAEKGYVESSVVVAERVGKDVGGGICQVSTTVFRAALRAGMSIGEWHPHTYRIQGYEHDGWGPGFDASILQLGDDPENWADLTFTNTTDGYILIQSWTAYPHVIVEIYGHDQGWTTEFTNQWVSDPIPAPETANEVVDDTLSAGTWDVAEYALEGLEANFVQVTRDAEGNVIVEKQFYTYFRERGILYKVAPDMVGQSPAG
jgi:vancomycin resistance protein YoaR